MYKLYIMHDAYSNKLLNKITEKHIEYYINDAKNKHKEQLKTQSFVDFNYFFTFSEMLQANEIDTNSDIDSNTIIKIEFNDKSSYVCKDFIFDFTNLKFKFLLIENVSFIKTQFANIEAEVIRFSNCKIDKIELGDNIKCEQFILENCEIDLLSFNTYKIDNVDFTFNKCKFENQASFYSMTFNKKVEFRDDCEFQYSTFNGAIFNEPVIFTGTKFRGSVYFDKAIFNDDVDFNHCEFENTASFSGATFKKEMNFKNCEFQDSVDFHKAIFGKQVIFNSAKFKYSAYFDDATFNDYADFSRRVFEKTVSFCGATFKEPPNFLQAEFKGSLNLVNTKLEFDYAQTRRIIKRQNDAQNKRIEKQNIENNKAKKRKKLYETANEFRDIFRLFKNVLIKDNNNLDASNFHKLELYCKEIELDFKKPETFSRDWIDSFVLAFYRYTSDHHTDLLKSFHSLLLVIGFFGFLSWIVIAGFAISSGASDIDPYILMKFYDSKIENSISKDSFYIFILNLLNIVIISLSLFFIIIVIYGFRQVQYFIQDVIDTLFKNWHFFIQKLYKKACDGFIAFIRYLFIAPSYIITILILVISPKYIIPAINIFTDKRSILDPLSVIGAIYTIFFALMLYSFIKTARKNSIIPS